MQCCCNFFFLPLHGVKRKFHSITICLCCTARKKSGLCIFYVPEFCCHCCCFCTATALQIRTRSLSLQEENQCNSFRARAWNKKKKKLVVKASQTTHKFTSVFVWLRSQDWQGLLTLWTALCQTEGRQGLDWEQTPRLAMLSVVIHTHLPHQSVHTAHHSQLHCSVNIRPLPYPFTYGNKK